MKITEQHLQFENESTQEAIRQAIHHSLKENVMVVFELNGGEYRIDPNRLVNHVELSCVEDYMRDELPY